MEQKKPDPEGVPPSDARPPPLERAESFLPPHFRPSNYEVPVTPGITREAYDSEHDTPTPVAGHSEESGYFSQKDIDHALAASPGPVGLDSGDKDFQAKIIEGAEESKDFLRRLSLTVMGGRRESISEIRKTSPDLSVTGGIISATFNIPHSLKYQKGADWVSCIDIACFMLPLSPSSRFRGGPAGVVPRFGWWG
jgi:trehalose 6-phosphate synthase/phosphatase